MSAPPTPPSERPSVKDSRFKPMGTPCEPVDSYRPGGFHPVHFGDILHDRYRVIRKLGYGSYATVWLAVDFITTTHVALKIHTANMDVSTEVSIQHHLTTKSEDPSASFILLLTTSFELEGPNGRHVCFVTEPMGPSISAVLTAPHKYYDPVNPPSWRFPTSRNKSFLRNVLSGLEFLHSNNVVHGDLQSGILLFSLRDLTTFDNDGLEQNEKNSQLDPVKRLDGKVDKWAPKYLAVPKPFTEEALPLEQQVVKLADFGGAFWSDKPPSSVVTPLALRAPETILCDTVGPAIDIWSFTNVIDDNHLIQLSEIIGRLPDDMLAKWPRYNLYFCPDGARLNTRPQDFDESKFGQLMKARRTNFDPPTPMAPMEDKFHQYKSTDIDEVEGKVIASLLRDILQIDPTKRPTASDLLAHA